MQMAQSLAQSVTLISSLARRRMRTRYYLSALRRLYLVHYWVVGEFNHQVQHSGNEL